MVPEHRENTSGQHGVDRAATIQDLIDRANRYDDAGRFQAARDLYEQAITLAPGNCAVLFHYGVACGGQTAIASKEQAVKLYRDVLRINGAHAGAHANLACVFASLGKPNGVARHCRAAIDLGMQVFQLYYLLGKSCAYLGEFGQACRALTQALELAHDEASQRKIHEELAMIPQTSETSTSNGIERMRDSKGPAYGTTMAGPTLPELLDQLPTADVFSADTNPTVCRRLAALMEKTFVRATFMEFVGNVSRFHFVCRDGDYQAELTDRAMVVYRTVDRERGSEVLRIDKHGTRASG